MDEKVQKKLEQRVVQCYQSLAFSKGCDGMRLLFLENPTQEELKKMNFADVAHVKRPKTGGVEIEFCDRLKALESFAAYLKEQQDISPLYQALTQMEQV